MFGIQNYGTFLAAILVFQLMPGAGSIAILNATARNGIGAVFGTLCGDLVYMLAAVAGLAAVMNANPALFRAMQWFGVAYLLWTGIQLLHRPVNSAPDCADPKDSGWVYFRQAMAVSLTNPKVMLFSLAFFPLFLRPGASHLTLLAMMMHVTLISLLYQVALVLLGNSVAQWLRSVPFIRKLATCLAGAALIGFGVRLVAKQH